MGYLAIWRSGWNTNDEIKYIRAIGEGIKTFKADKADLLRGYLESCDKRKDWGGIDKALCINEAKIELLACGVANEFAPTKLAHDELLATGRLS